MSPSNHRNHTNKMWKRALLWNFKHRNVHAHDKVCVYPELSLQTRRLQRLKMTNFPGEFPFPAPLAFHIPHWHSKVGIHRGSVLFYPVVACCGWNKTRCFPSVRVSSPRYSGLGAHHTGLQWFFLRQHTAEGPPGLSLISSSLEIGKPCLKQQIQTL